MGHPQNSFPHETHHRVGHPLTDWFGDAIRLFHFEEDNLFFTIGHSRNKELALTSVTCLLLGN